MLRPDHADLHLEHEVPAQGGRGKSSYTDLMILAGDVTVAIEGRFTGPRYDSVGAWLGRAPTTNRVTYLRDGFGRSKRSHRRQSDVMPSPRSRTSRFTP